MDAEKLRSESKTMIILLFGVLLLLIPAAWGFRWHRNAIKHMRINENITGKIFFSYCKNQEFSSKGSNE